MALLTLIARVSDGLALSASIQDEEVKYEFYVSVYTYVHVASLHVYSLDGTSPTTRRRPSRYFANFLLSLPPNAALRATNWSSSESILTLLFILSPHTRSYVLEEGICYLALCEQTYPPQLAFTYLENVHRDFNEQHGQNIHRAQRPYHFIEFGKLDLIQK